MLAEVFVGHSVILVTYKRARFPTLSLTVVHRHSKSFCLLTHFHFLFCIKWSCSPRLIKIVTAREIIARVHIRKRINSASQSSK